MFCDEPLKRVEPHVFLYKFHDGFYGGHFVGQIIIIFFRK
jgi:hypothetical protein